MLEQVDGLYTLDETAAVVVDDAVIRSQADAGVLLIPDGPLWRVAAGVALRPLEYRLQLTDESWLIANVAGAGKGILIQDSDVARQNLRGAPLASRGHLLAVPVPDVHAVLLLARDRDEPFTERTLGALADLAAESAPLLLRAMDLRVLARALARHLDAGE
jgi:hypothetical protein